MENKHGSAGEVLLFDAELAEAAQLELREDLARAGCSPVMLEELRQKHGEIHILKVKPKSADPVVVLAKKPGRPEWRKLQSDGNDPGRKPLASEAFVRACIVFPDQKAFDAILASWPGLVRPFSDELLGIAGVEDGSSRKA